MSYPPQSFKPILNARQRLFADYQQKIRQQQQLLSLIKTVLPSELGAHALHCVLNGKRFVLYTDAAAWSSQLRFYQQSILHKLKEHGFRQIETLQIKLMPKQATKNTRLAIKIPSKKNIALLRQQAGKLPTDKLHRALSRLGETLDKLSSKQDDSSEKTKG